MSSTGAATTGRVSLPSRGSFPFVLFLDVYIFAWCWSSRGRIVAALSTELLYLDMHFAQILVQETILISLEESVMHVAIIVECQEQVYGGIQAGRDVDGYTETARLELM